MEENWRETAQKTTYREGRERGLDTYEGYLGFKREELQGLTILDLGSGQTERFSRELKDAGVEATVVPMNPDYIFAEDRNRIGVVPDRQKMSVAGIGQELPFSGKSFDRVFALYSLTVFANPGANRERAIRWAFEIVRVLKPGGEARIASIIADTDEEVWRGEYKEVFQLLKEEGIEVEVQRIKYHDLGITGSTWLTSDGVKHHKPYTQDKGTWEVRIILKKPYPYPR